MPGSVNRCGCHLGWEPDRLDALHGLWFALMEALPPQVGPNRDLLAISCSRLKSLLQGVAREAVVGKMGWVRE